MNIRVQKISDGIEFTIQTTGKSRINPNHKVVAARAVVSGLVAKVVDTYTAEVLEVLKKNNMPVEQFQKYASEVRPTKTGAFMKLEPVGFGFGTFEEPEMPNMGSTPTPGRARLLLAYQAPLNKIEVSPGQFQFYKDYTV